MEKNIVLNKEAKTSNRKKAGSYIPNLSGLRFWWILLIVFAHFFAVVKYCSPEFAELPVFLTNGHFAAMGFLALSGFLMYSHHGKEHAEGNPFKKGISLYLKGFVRFFLLNTLTMIPFVAADVAGGKFSVKYGIMVVMNLLFVQDWIPGRHYSLNGVAWFLSNLMFIYLIIPFLFKVYRFIRGKAGLAWTLVLVGAPMLILLGLESFVRFDAYKNPLYSTCAFMLGALLADALGSLSRKNHPWLWLVGTVFMILGFVYTPVKMPYLWDTALSMVILLCMYCSSDFPLYSGRGITSVGDAGLEIMLIHYPICSLPFKSLILRYQFGRIQVLALMLGSIVVSVAIAYVWSLVKKKIKMKIETK
ncbi:MAG: acyltransferase [Lachnospiraceae bacterium]|nr:acyltransferase [Lachnospiraceae bacterium]